MATGHLSNPIRLWSMPDGKAVRELRGHTSFVMSLAFSPDRAQLASGGHDNVVKLWNPTSGKETRSLARHSKCILSLCFSTNGRLLATGAVDGKICVWNTENGRIVQETTPIRSSIDTLQFLDNEHLVCGTRDGHVLICDLQTEKVAEAFRDMHPIVVSRDGRTTANGGLSQNAENVVEVWEIGSKRQLKELKGGEHPLHSLAFSGDGRLLAGESKASGSSIVLWEVLSGQAIESFEDRLGAVVGRRLLLSEDGRYLVSFALGVGVLVWDLSSGSNDEPDEFRVRSTSELWEDLAGPDARAACRAVWQMAKGGKQVREFLRRKLKRVERMDGDVMSRLIGELNSETYEVRRAALRRLELLGEAAEAGLRKYAGNSELSAEQQRSIDKLLSRIDSDKIRQMRAVAVLERMPAMGGMDFLRELASGAEGAVLTESAAGSLKRLTSRNEAK